MEDSTKHRKIYLQITMSWKRGKKTMLPHSNIAIARKNNDISITT
jgi:hypothetical protein